MRAANVKRHYLLGNHLKFIDKVNEIPTTTKELTYTCFIVALGLIDLMDQFISLMLPVWWIHSRSRQYPTNEHNKNDTNLCIFIYCWPELSLHVCGLSSVHVNVSLCICVFRFTGISSELCQFLSGNKIHSLLSQLANMPCGAGTVYNAICTPLSHIIY